MNALLSNTLRSLCALVVMCLAAHAAEAQTATSRIVGAANHFLSTLNEAQRRNAIFAFDDEQQRARWSNLPISSVKRAGVAMGELNEAQKSAAVALLAVALSRKGLEKVHQIMEGDELLRQSAGKPVFGRDVYYIAFLGLPSDQTTWMLQFGGHHLALNITVVGERGVLTPSLIGAQPALYTQNGSTIRPLGQESDKAFALLNSLSAAQRKQAILGYKVADLVLGPGQDGKTIQPEGLKASAMTEQQKTMLLDLIAEWAGIVHDSAAAARMAGIRAHLEETWFAWSGATTVDPGRNITAYYRIQGPTLVIEYAPQPLGGDPSLHVHTMYRDPTNDYGRQPIKK
jgi:hypothetical protein